MSGDASRPSFAELDLADFDFELPAAAIAQHPPAERDGGRLMRLDRTTGAVEHRLVREFANFLDPGDLLVVNATRVRAARLRGQKASGGKAEALLLGRVTETAPDRAKGTVEGPVEVEVV
ncbi:MAG: S-adenosylmethionine:tRNA ribosyltransferase-isomerase, partial [Polyangiaceae bacterium]